MESEAARLSGNGSGPGQGGKQAFGGVSAILFCLLAAWASATWLRLLDVPAWKSPSMRALGEPLMATVDAYYWLAGAEGLGRAAGSSLASAAAYASAWSGLSLATIGLWAPVLLAGLAGAAVCLWAFTLGLGEVALLAGVLAGAAPAYVYRTRPGFFDSDMVTLTMALLIGWTLAHGLGPWMHRSRLDAGHEDVGPGLRLFIWMAAAGLFGRFCAQWHVLLAVFTQLSFLLSVAGVLLSPSVPHRTALLWGCGAYALTAFCGWPGLVAAVLCVCFMARGQAALLRQARRLWPVLCLLVLILGLAGILQNGVNETLAYLQRARSKSVTVADMEVQPPVGSIVYPRMTETIAEGRPLSVAALPGQWHPWEGVALSGLVGFVVLLWRRPRALLLAPLLLLSLASVWLGGRTAMYGAPAMALGLAWLVQWAASQYFPGQPWRRRATYLLQLVLAGLLFWPCVVRIGKVELPPVLHPAHAQVLHELGRSSPPSARVWSWWDYGYASLYFSGRLPFADGGRQGPEYVYVSGKVLTARDPAQAAALMRYTASHDYAPWNAWSGMGPAEVDALVASPALLRQSFTREPDPQYLVLSSDTLLLAPEIFRLGAWSLSHGQAQSPYCARLEKTYTVDVKTGTLFIAGEAKPVLLRRVVVLQKPRNAEFHFAHSSGLSLVRLPATGLSLLMDERAFSSMLVQLMVRKADDPWLNRSFDLAQDAFPLSRVWKVRDVLTEKKREDELAFRGE